MEIGRQVVGVETGLRLGVVTLSGCQSVVKFLMLLVGLDCRLSRAEFQMLGVHVSYALCSTLDLFLDGEAFAHGNYLLIGYGPTLMLESGCRLVNEPAGLGQYAWCHSYSTWGAVWFAD
jgi:hypothetical protein